MQRSAAHLQEIERDALGAQDAARVAAHARKHLALLDAVAVALCPLHVDASAAHGEHCVRDGGAREDAVGLCQERRRSVGALRNAARRRGVRNLGNAAPRVRAVCMRLLWTARAHAAGKRCTRSVRKVG